MKKLFFLLIAVCGLSGLSQAQLLERGIKGGVNFGTADLQEIQNGWENEGITTGVHLGFFGRLNLGPLYLQPEAYYTFTQANLSRELTTSPQVPETFELDFHRLDVPVMLGFKLGSAFRIHGGPFASVLLNAQGDSSERSLEEHADDLYRRAIWGWQGGIGVDFLRLTLDARYETTVGDLRDQDFNNPSLPDMLPNDQSQRQLILSLGYKF